MKREMNQSIKAQIVEQLKRINERLYRIGARARDQDPTIGNIYYKLNDVRNRILGAIFQIGKYPSGELQLPQTLSYTRKETLGANFIYEIRQKLELSIGDIDDVINQLPTDYNAIFSREQNINALLTNLTNELANTGIIDPSVAQNFLNDIKDTTDKYRSPKLLSSDLKVEIARSLLPIRDELIKILQFIQS